MSRTRVIIDTDPGVDDAAAIWLALASPELEVLGVTTVAGNVPLDATLANACRVVALAGRTDVPVMAGAQRPLLRDQIFGKYASIGAFSETLVPEDRVAPTQENAIAFIARMARQAAAEGKPITLCTMGPLTNVAMALRLHPQVAEGIERIVCMGGSFQGRGQASPMIEFNVRADPHAAKIVFRSVVPLILFPLDVTLQALFTKEHIAVLRATGSVPGTALANLLTAYDRSDPSRYGRDGGPLHDPMPLAWLIAPQLFSGRGARVDVRDSGETSGLTYADFQITHAPATVMTDVNEPGYIALVIDRIAATGALPALGTLTQEETTK